MPYGACSLYSLVGATQVLQSVVSFRVVRCRAVQCRVVCLPEGFAFVHSTELSAVVMEGDWRWREQLSQPIWEDWELDPAEVERRQRQEEEQRRARQVR